MEVVRHLQLGGRADQHRVAAISRDPTGSLCMPRCPAKFLRMLYISQRSVVPWRIYTQLRLARVTSGVGLRHRRRQ